MIDVGTERLLPAKELPMWLEARGYGRRVTMRTVNRWIERGSDGARLEAVNIGGQLMTSVEAVQRWVEGQNPASRARDSSSHAPAAGGSAPAHSAPTVAAPRGSERVLVEHRLLPTELDLVIDRDRKSNDATRRLVAGVLFRAGHRSIAALARAPLESLLSLPRIGKASSDLVRRLKDEHS